VKAQASASSRVLDQHRSGDQFNIYICDRFIVPELSAAQQREIGQGRLLLDQMTKNYIREHLSYRIAVYGDGGGALGIERAARADGLPAGRPCFPSQRATSMVRSRPRNKGR
jgi:hypothetical protein